MAADQAEPLRFPEIQALASEMKKSQLWWSEGARAAEGGRRLRLAEACKSVAALAQQWLALESCCLALNKQPQPLWLAISNS